jgi:hypothetical protein
LLLSASCLCSHYHLISFVEDKHTHSPPIKKVSHSHKNSNFRYLQWQLTSTISTIATTLNLSSTVDLTPILHEKLATSICTTATKFCNGTNLQYQNQTACENHLVNETRFGEGWEWGMDTVSCRMVSLCIALLSLLSPCPKSSFAPLARSKLYMIILLFKGVYTDGYQPQIHQNMVPLRPEVHCPHIGPSGGGMCVDDRTYIGNLEENYFVNTPFLAPGLEGGVFS